MKTIIECINEQDKISAKGHLALNQVFELIAHEASLEAAAYIFICQTMFRLHEHKVTAEEARDFIKHCVNLNLLSHKWE